MNKIDLLSRPKENQVRAVATISRGTRKSENKSIIPAEILNFRSSKRVKYIVPLKTIGDYRDKVDITVKGARRRFHGQAFASTVAKCRALTGAGKGGRDQKTIHLQEVCRTEFVNELLEFDRHLLSGESKTNRIKEIWWTSGARRRKTKVI
jgi:small subunit ribosomal protein S9